MTTTYETDPNTQTIAAAWASSALGQPDREVGFGFDEPEPVAEAPRSTAKHAMLSFALSGGIAAGVAAALMFVDPSPADQTVVVPSTTSPQHAVVLAPSSPASSPAIVAPVQGSAPAPSTVVDVPTPGDPPPADEPQNNYPMPPEPEDPSPEPPKPHVPPVPPGLDDFKLPEPPKPKPPLFDPGLPLAPKPQPAPTPDPSDFVPDLGLTS